MISYSVTFFIIQIIHIAFQFTIEDANVLTTTKNFQVDTVSININHDHKEISIQKFNENQFTVVYKNSYRCTQFIGTNAVDGDLTILPYDQDTVIGEFYSQCTFSDNIDKFNMQLYKGTNTYDYEARKFQTDYTKTYNGNMDTYYYYIQSAQYGDVSCLFIEDSIFIMGRNDQNIAQPDPLDLVYQLTSLLYTTAPQGSSYSNSVYNLIDTSLDINCSSTPIFVNLSTTLYLGCSGNFNDGSGKYGLSFQEVDLNGAYNGMLIETEQYIKFPIGKPISDTVMAFAYNYGPDDTDLSLKFIQYDVKNQKQICTAEFPGIYSTDIDIIDDLIVLSGVSYVKDNTGDLYIIIIRNNNDCQHRVMKIKSDVFYQTGIVTSKINDLRYAGIIIQNSANQIEYVEVEVVDVPDEEQEQEQETESFFEQYKEYIIIGGAAAAGSGGVAGSLKIAQKIRKLKRKSKSKVQNLQNNNDAPDNSKRDLLESEEVSQFDKDGQNQNKINLNDPEKISEKEFKQNFQEIKQNKTNKTLDEDRLFDSVDNELVDNLKIEQNNISEKNQIQDEIQTLSLVSTASNMFIMPKKTYQIYSQSDVKTVKDTINIIQPVSGQSLAQQIQNNKENKKQFKISQIEQVLHDMIKQLIVLNENSKAHGCINPTNIFAYKKLMVGKQYYKSKIVGNNKKRGFISKIILFSKKKLAKIDIRANKQLKQIPLTPEEASQYLSPEEKQDFFKKENNYQPSKPKITSDIFSLGIILFEMMSLQDVQELNLDEASKNKNIKLFKENIEKLFSESQNQQKADQNLKLEEFSPKSPIGTLNNLSLKKKRKRKSDNNSNQFLLDLESQRTSVAVSPINKKSSNQISSQQLDFYKNYSKKQEKIQKYQDIIELMELMLEFRPDQRISLEEIKNKLKIN
ncbi:Protein kinase-like domain [Pseudocohnilembus persalinus]|uniref:Protein kinase-like domain n=1 Tax=Pseudocohnilembus persalinus TaxID=266149 RepID=A0A0V0QJP2_PSEPJ|nr:Protein kinase-like domain [Pseudocohnilembus persalinus]|eukprot:KRX02420.1 Protein kinase-like domain [Pseudocohnilembus persalinus]